MQVKRLKSRIHSDSNALNENQDCMCYVSLLIAWNRHTIDFGVEWRWISLIDFLFKFQTTIQQFEYLPCFAFRALQIKCKYLIACEGIDLELIFTFIVVNLSYLSTGWSQVLTTFPQGNRLRFWLPVQLMRFGKLSYFPFIADVHVRWWWSYSLTCI